MLAVDIRNLQPACVLMSSFFFCQYSAHAGSQGMCSYVLAEGMCEIHFVLRVAMIVRAKTTPPKKKSVTARSRGRVPVLAWSCRKVLVLAGSCGKEPVLVGSRTENPVTSGHQTRAGRCPCKKFRPFSRWLLHGITIPTVKLNSEKNSFMPWEKLAVLLTQLQYD